MTQEPTHPFPPRFWWLKRLIVLGIFLTCAYFAAMRWWQYEAEKRLNAEITALRAAGQPVLYEDFDSPPIADADNAAVSLNAAAAATTLSATQDSFLGTFDRDAIIDAVSLSMLGQIDQANTKTFELARIARFQSDAEWGIKLRSPVIRVLFPHLGTQRRLSNLLGSTIIYQHLRGNDAEAIERIRDVLHQSDALQKSPVMISFLVAVSISRLACSDVQTISYDLSILPDSAATTKPTGPASRQQIEALISDLLDERASRQGLAYAFYSERLMDYDAAVSVIGRSTAAPPGFIPSPVASSSILQPMFDLDALHMMRLCTQYARTAAAADFPAAKAMEPDLSRRETTVLTMGTHLMTFIMMPALDRMIETNFIGLTERRIAALRLAIRLYQVDHHGHLPENIGELSPGYIPALPADPFRADGKTFGYIRSPQPFLYSVGKNQLDEQGDTTLDIRHPATTKPAGSPRDNLNWDRRDVIFPLEKPQPYPQPTTDEN